ncbi:hydrogenase 3 membrane subunit, partial [Klebsiella pneumoniae]|nr:hydrogenase 3 membrane subunit [Klebsiella pneumoniae]
APLWAGRGRVARARLPPRRGPGGLQESRALLNRRGRQSVGPAASGGVWRLTPYVRVGVLLTRATARPVGTVDSPRPVLGDL